MQRHRSAGLVVLVLLLAGCSGDPSRSNEAGGTDAPDDAGRTSVGAEEGGAVPTAFEDVSWDGDLGTHLCAAPAGTQVCPTTPLGPPTDPANRDVLLFIAATTGPATLSGNLTLTWEAADYEVTSSMTAVRAIYTGCPDACRFGRGAGSVTGKSPLTITLEGIDLAAADRVGLYLQPVHSQVANTQVTASAGQAVHLEGRIGSAPA